MSQIYNRPEYKERRRELRRNLSFAEVIFWLQLKGRQFKGLKFRRQHGMDAYILDFYCPDLKLAIEVDGNTHSTTEEVRKDRQRSEFLKQFGISVVRFTNDEVLDNMDGVLQKLDQVTESLQTKRNHP